MRGKWFLFAILALPAAELLTLVVISHFVGVGPALLALLAISGLGILLFRWQRQRAGGLHIRLNEQRTAAIDLSEVGLHRWASAILLIIPGFITGALGGLMLIGPVRRHILKRFKTILAPMREQRPEVVDLPEEDWRVVPDRQIEDRR